MFKQSGKTHIILKVVLILLAALILLLEGLYHLNSIGLSHTQSETETAGKPIRGIVFHPARKTPEFSVKDAMGREFSSKNLSGHWTLLLLGNQHCPFICPVSMASLNKMYHALAMDTPEPLLPRVIVLSTDPARDTFKSFGEYVQSFNPNFLGVVGTTKTVHTIERSLHPIIANIKGSGAPNAISNTDYFKHIYILNPKGQIQGALNYPYRAQSLTHFYQALLKQPNRKPLSETKT